MTQDTALDILKIGANVFLTGEPGSGKTHTINRYIEYLHRHGVDPAVTASTGIAATHVGGYTIHSWSGIGARTELDEWALEELTQKEQAVKRVNKTDVLIVEEVSMLDARFIDTLDEVLRALRQRDEAFGGMQVIFVGDFFQLPPVSRERQMQFAFRARAWREAKPVVCYLHEQYRQEDQEFLTILAALRKRDVRDEHVASLIQRRCDPDTEREEPATQLYSHNADVDRINDEELGKLATKLRTYEMNSDGTKSVVESLKKGCLSPETLTLKVGAVVMFTKNNFEEGYVNGTVGEVVDFDSSDSPIVETTTGERLAVGAVDWAVEHNGVIRAKITQLPLRLAWAITVHKSQGMSMDSAIVDLSKAFEYGQGYVALSRVRSLKGLHLIGFNERALQVHPDVADQDAEFHKRSRAAEKRFAELEAEKLQKMHGNFLTAIGGTLGEISDEELHGEKKVRRARSAAGETYEKTLGYLKEGWKISAVAKERGLSPSTVFSHVEKLVQNGRIDPSEVRYLWEETERTHDELEDIQNAFSELDTTKLTPVMRHFDNEYSFDELKLARILM
ncbi:MAG: helix-turn-helix domain-containing protein [Candidatus Paceibacterota bacterium]